MKSYTVPKRQACRYRNRGGWIRENRKINSNIEFERLRCVCKDGNVGVKTTTTVESDNVKCPDCDICDGSGRLIGGIGSVPGFRWWPIKVNIFHCLHLILFERLQ